MRHLAGGENTACMILWCRRGVGCGRIVYAGALVGLLTTRHRQQTKREIHSSNVLIQQLCTESADFTYVLLLNYLNVVFLLPQTVMPSIYTIRQSIFRIFTQPRSSEHTISSRERGCSSSCLLSRIL